MDRRAEVRVRTFALHRTQNNLSLPVNVTWKVRNPDYLRLAGLWPVGSLRRLAESLSLGILDCDMQLARGTGRALASVTMALSGSLSGQAAMLNFFRAGCTQSRDQDCDSNPRSLD